jgi:hypothetical protein
MAGGSTSGKAVMVARAAPTKRRGMAIRLVLYVYTVSMPMQAKL